MADFNQWILPGKRRYSRVYGYGNPPVTYQNLYNDRGNWTSGQIGVGIQAGTNRSISAYLLSALRGHPVTADEMKALTVQEALSIYKTKFWDDILADQIISQVIAEFAADMKSSTGNNKALQIALNDIGYNVDVDGDLGQQTLTAINQANKDGKTPALYEAHRQRMIEHYATTNFATALTNQLNDDYPQRNANDPIFQIPSGSGKAAHPSNRGIFITLTVTFGIIVWNKYRNRKKA